MLVQTKKTVTDFVWEWRGDRGGRGVSRRAGLTNNGQADPLAVIWRTAPSIVYLAVRAHRRPEACKPSVGARRRRRHQGSKPA